MAATPNQETLLYGALAVELRLADREAVARALEAWALDPSRPIGGLLGEHCGLDEGDRARIEEAVRLELERHGDDPGRALAAIGSVAVLTLGGTDADWSAGLVAESDDPFATVADGMPTGPFREPVDSIERTDADPFETRFGPGPGPGPRDPGRRHGSDINPIPSALRARHDRGGPTDSGSVPTPDLGPPSSIDLPSPGPSGGSGTDDLPRFDPSSASGYDRGAAPGFDPSATSDAWQQEATELGSSGIAPDDLDRHDPLATSAVAMEATFPGPFPGRSSGSIGVSGTSSSRFRVDREYARGGLGVVHVAFDEELRREVALKEIQDRHADDPDSRSRFLLEAEVTGGLEHPGVVPVYSLGANPDGRPFYAMRFIRGESLRKAIEHFHHPERGPRDPGERSLQLRALLRRFVDVCNALEYAHSRGVIHRDVKPDNVMLGPYGETLVVDWGLAKPLDRAEVPSRTEEMPLRPVSAAGSTPTLDGSAIGTPAFMSPEQAEGDLARMGPASDVYSLGATLYQILAGVPPFTERNLLQVLLKVRDGEFPPPSQVKPGVPPALEAICLTAMARSIEDRYTSCRSLADDLEHWLADEPVSVYREPWAVRLGRWAKRHRTLVTTAAALLIAAVVGLSVGAFMLEQERARTARERQSAVEGWNEARLNAAEAEAQRAAAERNAEQARLNAAEARENARVALENEQEAQRNEALAQENEARAIEQRAIAERNFQSAIAAVDSLLTEVGEIDLADVPQMEQARRDLLLKARDFYERFLSQNDGPETRRDAGRSHGRLGDIHELLGDDAEARSSYDRALAIQEPLAAANPDDPEFAADLARTRHDLAILLKKLNEFEASEALLDRARSTRAALLEASPEDLDARSDLASSTYQLGAVLSRLVGRLPEARDLYDRAIVMQREVVAGRDDHPEDRRELARFLNNRAILLQATEPEAAVAAFDEAIALQRVLVEENSDVPHYTRELARSLNNRVRDAIVNDPDAAEGPLREAIAMAERLTADYPKVPEYWSELGGYLSNLGRSLIEHGRRDDDQDAAGEAEDLFRRAEEAFRRSESIRSELVEQYPMRPEYRQRLALVRQNLSRFIRGRGDGEAALPILESAIEHLRELVGDHPGVPEYQKDLALALRERAFSVPDTSEGKTEGLPIAEEGLRLAESAARDRPNDTIYRAALMAMQHQVGILDRDLGRHREAMERARALGGLAPGDATWSFNAAALLLDAAIGADRAGDLDDEQRDATLAEAAQLLRQAAEAGYDRSDQAELKFGPFADRPDVAEALDAIRGRSRR